LRVLLFGSEFLPSIGPREPYWGRGVIERNFVSALLNHRSKDLKIGVLTSDPNTLLTSPFLRNDDTVIYNFDSVSQLLADDDDVVLQSLSTSLEKQCHLRWLMRKPHWAVLGVTHDLSDGSVFRGMVSEFLRVRPYCDSIVCCSKSAKHVVSNYLAQVDNLLNVAHEFDLPIIPHGAVRSIEYPLTRSEARLRLGVPISGVIFLYLGRLSLLFKADLLKLLHVFEGTFKDRDAHLVLAGGVSDRESEKSMITLRSEAAARNISNRIIIMPNVDATMKHVLLSAADVFVSPANSFQESFGVAIVEAMLYQLPVVCGNWSGYKDIVVNGTTGYLIATTIDGSLANISLGGSALGEECPEFRSQ
jgi:glycosyltransferase involved in cell wall biosynthesis